jgi:exonuclease III
LTAAQGFAGIRRSATPCQGWQPFGLRDVFRSLHGYDVEACSWVVRRKQLIRGRRFDHVFASAALSTVSCDYLTAFREDGLSDHAAIEVVLQGT